MVEDVPGEAIIRFRYSLSGRRPAGAAAAARTLAPVQRRALRLGFLGRDPRRYDGLAYGNLSARLPPAAGFWVTATQRADRPHLEADDVVHVTRWDLGANAVDAEGTAPPSSECLTHAAVHDARSEPVWVLHGHHPILWQAAPALGLASTPAHAVNGSVALARAVAAAAGAGASTLRLDGHRDGLVLWAPDPEHLLARLEALLAAC